MRFFALGCLLVSSLVVEESRACFCFSTPMCNKLSDAFEKRSIFVGTATDLYPASLDAYRLLDSALNGSGHGALAKAKALILQFWGQVLSFDEARSIKLSSSRDELRNAWMMGMLPRRVRFRVSEWIDGNSGQEFELFTDDSDCGYRFEAGREYLVVSWQPKETTTWWTGACSRNAPVESDRAVQDLRALRAFRDGRPLAPRIYGQIYDRRHRQPSDTVTPGPADFIIRLTGPSSEKEIRPDDEGRFSFDNLAPASHRIEVVASGARGDAQEIDLSHDRCYEAEVVIEPDSNGMEYTILGGGAPSQDWESGVFATPPPVLPAPARIPLIFSGRP